MCTLPISQGTGTPSSSRSCLMKTTLGQGLCVFLFVFRFTKRARVIELQNACAFWSSITHARYCYLSYMSTDMSGSDLLFQVLWKRSVFFFYNVSLFLKSKIASKRSLNFLHTPYSVFCSGASDVKWSRGMQVLLLTIVIGDTISSQNKDPEELQYSMKFTLLRQI